MFAFFSTLLLVLYSQNNEPQPLLSFLYTMQKEREIIESRLMTLLFLKTSILGMPYLGSIVIVFLKRFVLGSVFLNMSSTDK